MVGAFGCESTLQFNVIAEIESAKTPYTMIKTDDETMEKTNQMSTMNEAIDNVL